MMQQSSCRRMHRSIKNARMSEIHRQLQYKAQKCVKVDRFFASSQICSSCGSKHKMPLKERTYVCPECGLILDRDINASKNIRNQYLSGQGMSIVCCEKTASFVKTFESTVNAPVRSKKLHTKAEEITF